jgi:hypothetical protein
VVNLWFKEAVREEADKDAGHKIGGFPKGVWHKTEGTSYEGALATYKRTKNWPHMTVGLEDGKAHAWQHISYDRAARALMHKSDQAETNRWNAFQIEIVGMVDKPLDDSVIVLLHKIAVWLEDDFALPRLCTVQFVPHNKSNLVRMSVPKWKAYSGWCGHQHVPGNDHGDPGYPFPVHEILHGLT